MKNYAELLNKLTKYGPRVIITSITMRYYAQINGINFYADKDYICYELKREKGVYLILGKVGVSSDKEVYKNWHEAMNMLSVEKELAEELPLDLEKLNDNEHICYNCDWFDLKDSVCVNCNSPSDIRKKSSTDICDGGGCGATSTAFKKRKW